VLGVDPAGILIGNGSDDVLTIITRAFVPEGGLVVSPTPSYLLYRTLAELQGARHVTIPFTPDWRLDPSAAPRDANITYIPSPNSPSGTAIAPEILERWPGPLVIDEAYADFAEENCLPLAKKHERILVTRSLSKSYSLAGIRFGFAVGAPELVQQLYKVKDSYNCDVLSLAAATAALADQEHMRANRDKIIATRGRTTAALRQLGFDVPDSQANFVWARHREQPARPIYEELKNRKILIRYMSYAGYGDGLRISIGTDAEMERLLEQIRQLV
jgi:histidinol-phosphate aminotransferase